MASGGAAVDLVSAVATRSMLVAGDGDGSRGKIPSDALVDNRVRGLAGDGSDSGLGVLSDGGVDSSAGSATGGGVCNSVGGVSEWRSEVRAPPELRITTLGATWLVWVISDCDCAVVLVVC